MALDQSVLLDLLAQLKLTDVTDRVRSATEKPYQELIDMERCPNWVTQVQKVP